MVETYSQIVAKPSSGSMSNWNYGAFVRGFRLGKLLDGLGCNIVIILDMHSGFGVNPSSGSVKLELRGNLDQGSG